MSILISGAHPVPHRPAPYGIIIAAMGDVRVLRSATPTAVIFTLNQDSLVDYAYWLYRARVRGDSVRRIGIEYSKAHSLKSDGRGTINYGITKAEGLLSLAVTLPPL